MRTAQLKLSHFRRAREVPNILQVNEPLHTPSAKTTALLHASCLAALLRIVRPFSFAPRARKGKRTADRRFFPRRPSLLYSCRLNPAASAGGQPRAQKHPPPQVLDAWKNCHRRFFPAFLRPHEMKPWGKPWFGGTYRGIESFAGFLWWCRSSSIHSMSVSLFLREPPNKGACPFGVPLKPSKRRYPGTLEKHTPILFVDRISIVVQKQEPPPPF